MIINDDQEFKAPKDLVIGFTNDSLKDPSLILNNKETAATSSKTAAQQTTRQNDIQNLGGACENKAEEAKIGDNGLEDEGADTPVVNIVDDVDIQDLDIPTEG